ncbi:uncharacterized protein BBA_04177 [Beauveria bassiana ARSEF 2860]|uniref:Uncharacterized protein n=1 Tax=Beauveria bassiana (strain ARSEF 2860) TaxID=655819 RepID=J4KP59_BEAB2|nr:uncharacterized protein BBA_04177 [Beauveria bassiana ARSEF 2860]EJP66884.1 hypothetical protein BBA_04177 [Beauveria bassiana ARSEF 2860]
MGHPKQSLSRWQIFLQDTLVPLLTSRRTYVPDEFLQDRGIILKSLDLETGDIAGAVGTARLVPMPAKTILRIPGRDGEEEEKRERIQEENADIPIRGNADWEEREKKDQDARFFGAMRVHDIATSYAYGWGLRDQTMWNQSGFLRHYDSKGIPRYSILTVCAPVKMGCQLDETRPCIVGYQSDVTPLEDGRLLVSELNAFLVLASRYGERPAYADCDELVITVITGSDRQVRIAQSRVNFVNNIFDVSLSRILDFETTIGKNFDDFITLVGWFACSVAPRTSWA